MAGYIRQSVADIINGANITAPPLNAEFNQIQEAFGNVAGHTHTGNTGDGPKLPLQTSVSGYLPLANGGVGGKHNTTATSDPQTTDDLNGGYAVGSIWINASTDRVFICRDNSTSNAKWGELLHIPATNVVTPKITNTVDLGSSALQFKNLYVDGVGNIDTLYSDNLEVSGTANLPTINSSGTIAGATISASVEFQGALSGNVTGNVTGNTAGIHTGSVVGNTAGIHTGSVVGNTAGIHTGSVDANNTNLTNVSTATADDHAVNKGQLDAAIGTGTNSVDQFRIDTQKLAINPEDAQYTISTGVTGFSALHFAAKASASRTAAATSETNASTSETSAANSALIASQKAALVSNSLDAAQGSLIGVLI